MALKEIQERHADHAESRARFVLEAEVTGSLEHPGIVPVYGLGSYADGRPYYAMRFIQGDSLKDAIDAFHAPPSPGVATPGLESLAFRQLLSRFVDVCNAIAYAHSRGVIHRDLKPANIMLGKYGETLVVDWGWPRSWAASDVETSRDGPGQLGRFRLDAGRPGDGHAGVHESGTGGGPARPTGAGQRRLQPGRHALLPAHRQGAVRGPRCRSVLARVQKGDFTPPRQVNATVPAALEAVCLKAMALQAGGSLRLAARAGGGHRALAGRRAGRRLSRAVSGPDGAAACASGRR